VTVPPSLVSETGKVRSGELAQRFGSHVRVRAQAAGGHRWLAGTTRRVAYCSAALTTSARAVELAGDLGAIDETSTATRRRPAGRGRRRSRCAGGRGCRPCASWSRRCASRRRPGGPRRPRGGRCARPSGLRGLVVLGAEKRVDELLRPRDYADEPVPQSGRARTTSSVSRTWPVRTSRGSCSGCVRAGPVRPRQPASVAAPASRRRRGGARSG
jgi:hypothetical protein